MKYILCDCCGKKIYLGDQVYNYGDYCGSYCSAECFADTYADITDLTLSHAENCMCKVYDEVVVQEELEVEKKKIEDAQKRIKELEKLL